MGLDFADLIYRCEKEFRIELNHDDISKLVRHAPYRRDWCDRRTHDILVRDLVILIEETSSQQKKEIHGAVFERLKKLIAECIGVTEEEIQMDSWFGQDLRMD